MEHKRGIVHEAKLFSQNTWKDRIGVELGKTRYSRLRGENKKFGSGHNFEVMVSMVSRSIRYLE